MASVDNGAKPTISARIDSQRNGTWTKAQSGRPRLKKSGLHSICNNMFTPNKTAISKASGFGRMDPGQNSRPSDHAENDCPNWSEYPVGRVPCRLAQVAIPGPNRRHHAAHSEYEDRKLPTSNTPYFNIDSTRIGWVVGSGLEYAMAPNWAVKGEAIYGSEISPSRLGRLHPGSSTFPANAVYNVRFNTSVAVVRVGLNYKFY